MKLEEYQTKLDLTLLFKEVICLPFKKEGDYIEMAASQSHINLIVFPQIAAAVKEIESFRKLTAVYVMVNKLPPGAVVPYHQDWLVPTPKQPKEPTIERWHLPLMTNLQALFCLKTEKNCAHLALGYWTGPIPYWKHHNVTNGGRDTRVHLIVDLDTPVRMGEYEK